MGWVRIDDHFDEHPKHAQIGPLGWGVWAAGLAYCNRNLTDGFIPRSVAMTLASFEVVDREGRVWKLGRTSGTVGEDIDMAWVIDLLVDAGLWEEVPGGYRVHDYLDYQPSKEDYLRDKERKREAGRKGGLASARARAQAPAQADGQARAQASGQAKVNDGHGAVDGSESPAQAPAQARAQAPASADAKQVLQKGSNEAGAQARASADAQADAQAKSNPIPNPIPNLNKSSPNGDGQARKRAARQPIYTDEHKRPVEYLKAKLQVLGIHSLPRDWHLKGYAVSRQMQEQGASADDLIACIDWMAEDPYWSRNMDSMAAVRGAWAQFCLSRHPPRASPERKAEREPVPAYYEPLKPLDYWEEGEP